MRHGGCFERGPRARSYTDGESISRAPQNYIPRRTMMKAQRSNARRERMSSDAYAGFIKLLLTPMTVVPRIDEDVEAYLNHLNAREPLTATARRAIAQPTDHAA
jgi:hypothetical protein